jgi:hypothetical protein
MLFISMRTVEWLVARIGRAFAHGLTGGEQLVARPFGERYIKLNITSRRELRDALAPTTRL